MNTNQSHKNQSDTSDATATLNQVVERRLINNGLLYFAVVVLLLCLFGQSVLTKELPQKKQIQVLYPRWGIGRVETLFNKGLQAGVLDNPDMVVAITLEGLGLEYVTSDDELQNIIDHLGQKNEANPIDLVIAFLPTANDFLLSHGETLFPGIPKIFVAPPSRAVTKTEGIPEAVVMRSATQTALSTNVARIFSLLPGTKHLVVVSGSGGLDQAYLVRVKRAIASHEAAAQAQVSYLVGLPLEGLLERVGKLEEHTAVLFLTYEQDTAKQVYRTIEVVGLVCDQSNAPVFGMSDTHLGEGIVGGKLVSIENYGKKTAEIAMKLLHGESPKSIAAVEGDMIDRYDWRQLKRWGISESRLPPESQIINKPLSIWEAHRATVIVAVVSLVVLLLFIIALVVNLIRRRKAEVALRGSHADHQKAQEIAHLGSWKLDLVTNELSWSDEIYRIFGLEPREFDETYEAFLERVHPEDRESVGNAYLHSIETGEPYEIIHRVLRPDGEIRTVREQCDHTKDNAGKVICSIGTVLDITELREAEAELRDSEAKYSSLVKHSGVGIAVFQDNQRVFYNSKMYEMLGYKEAEYKMVDFLAIVHPDDQSFVTDRLHRRVTETEVTPDLAELRVVTKSGEIRWIESDSEKTVWEGRPALQVYVKDITERKQAEMDLKKERDFSDTLIQTSPAFLVAIDGDGRTKMMNEAMLSALDYSAEEVEGKDYVDNFVTEADRDSLTAVFARMTQATESLSTENHVLTKDGCKLLVEWHGRPVFKSDGSMDFFIGVGIDITERQRAEEGLKESEERYRSMMEQSPLGIEILTPEGQISQVNPAWMRLWGLTEEDQIRVCEKYNMLGDEQLRKLGVMPLVEKAFAGEAVSLPPIEYDGSHATEDFELAIEKVRTAWVQAYLYPVKSANGEILNIVNTYEDITERKRAEEDSRKSEATGRALLNAAPDTVLLLDAAGAILDANETALRGFDRTSGELIGSCVWDLLPPDLAARRKSLAEGVYLSGKPTRFEDEREGIWFDNVMYPVFDKQQRVTGIAVVARNITETKRLSELESRAERLEMAGTIAGQVAHDLNNLLAPIMAYPEFIRDELPDGNQAHAYLDTIEEAAENISEINQDLLTMGRRGHYNQVEIDLNEVVLRAAREIQSLTQDVTVELDLGDDLMKIKGGESQLNRVLTNLLANARDAMQNTGQITVKTENYYADNTTLAFGRVPRGEYVKLTVADSGCGIPSDIIQNVLDPFFSTKTADTKRGSGLGLSIVDGVIKDHNGYLDLRSKVGQGTSFYIYLPVSRDEVEKDEAKPPAGGEETILVVDDDAAQRDVSSMLLTKLGYAVKTVESGEKAIEFLRENPQDLVLLDMVMPGGIDGADTYRQIKEINPHQKAIILSGYSGSDRVFEAQRLGAGTFVKKPVTRKTIAAAVRTELDKETAVIA